MNVIPVSKPSRAIKLKLEDGHVYFTPTSLMLYMLGMGWMLFEFSLHYETNNVFSMQNAIFLGMAATAFILFALLLVKKQAHLVNEDIFGGWGQTLLMTVGCTAGVIVINAITGFLMERETYFISNIEIYLFYAISAPVAEESLYRVFICTVIIILVMAAFNLAGKGSRRNNQVKLTIARITAITVSGISFSLSHLGVYGDEPLMLLSTFLGGTVMATFYVYTKNPFVPLMAHLFNNAIAAGVIITNAVMMLS